MPEIESEGLRLKNKRNAKYKWKYMYKLRCVGYAERISSNRIS